MPFGFPPIEPPPSGAGPAADGAVAAGTAYNSALTGFAFTKIGMGAWGPGNASHYLDASVDGGAMQGNGNLGQDQLSFEAVNNPTTVPWYLQFRARFPAPVGAPEDGSIGLLQNGSANLIMLTSRFDRSPTNLILTLKKATVEVFAATSHVLDGLWHTFAIGFTAPTLTIFVDGVSVHTVGIADMPTVALYISTLCNTFMQPRIAWFALSYVAP